MKTPTDRLMEYIIWGEDAMPCRVHECGEPFVEAEEKLCVNHLMDLREEQASKWGEEVMEKLEEIEYKVDRL